MIGALWLFAGDSASLTHYKISLVRNAKDFIASVFFADSATSENLKNKYFSANDKNGKVKILIVAGHDNESGGTEFKGIKEAEINVELANRLKEFLVKNNKFDVFMVRDEDSYNTVFLDYFEKERDSIKDFINKQKETMSELIRAGKIENVEGVIHNNAPAETALKLYGINKWANENGIDAVIHIHFNDDPTRNRRGQVEGKYSGFAIYVPEKQYSNAKISKDLAKSVFNRLIKYYPKSDLPKESEGIVEDQRLIAIGSHNTLDSAGMLIEYGYIYEAQFLNKKIRSASLKELAFQTYIGLVGFFENDVKLLTRYDTLFLPHKWEKDLQKGDKDNESVLALQAALVFEKLYPPKGFDKYRCPLSGNFGNCTALSLRNFQNKYEIDDSAEKVGELTKKKLNELYSQ